MSRIGMIGQISLAAANLSNEALKEGVEVLNLFGGNDGPAWIEHLKKIRNAGLPQAPKPLPQSSIVRVDRSIKPIYPAWLKEPLYPELEQSGPKEFDLAALDQYFFGKQNSGGYETGNGIHEHLKSDNLLDSCLSLQDALAIQQLGLETFRKHFKGKGIFFWKSVVRHRNGRLFVPYLVEVDGQVRLDWRWLESDWYLSSPALRFAS